MNECLDCGWIGRELTNATGIDDLEVECELCPMCWSKNVIEIKQGNFKRRRREKVNSSTFVDGKPVSGGG